MTTPVPRIVIALDGKMDFIQKTNPFGGGESKGKKGGGKPPKALNKPPSSEERAAIAADLKGLLSRKRS